MRGTAALRCLARAASTTRGSRVWVSARLPDSHRPCGASPAGLQIGVLAAPHSVFREKSMIPTVRK